MPDFNTVKIAKNAQNLRRAHFQFNRPGKRIAVRGTLMGDIPRASKRAKAVGSAHIMLVEGVSHGFCA